MDVFENKLFDEGHMMEGTVEGELKKGRRRRKKIIDDLKEGNFYKGMKTQARQASEDLQPQNTNIDC